MRLRFRIARADERIEHGNAGMRAHHLAQRARLVESALPFALCIKRNGDERVKRFCGQRGGHRPAQRQRRVEHAVVFQAADERFGRAGIIERREKGKITGRKRRGAFRTQRRPALPAAAGAAGRERLVQLLLAALAQQAVRGMERAAGDAACAARMKQREERCENTALHGA